MKKHKQKKKPPHLIHKQPPDPAPSNLKANLNPARLETLLPLATNLTTLEAKRLAASFAMETMRDASFQILKILLHRGYELGTLVQVHLGLGTLLGGLEIINASDAHTARKIAAAEELLTLGPEALFNLLPGFAAKTLDTARKHFINPSPQSIQTQTVGGDNATCADSPSDSQTPAPSADPVAPLCGGRTDENSPRVQGQDTAQSFVPPTQFPRPEPA